MNYEPDARSAIIPVQYMESDMQISEQEEVSNVEGTERHRLTRPSYVKTGRDHQRASSVYACVYY